MVQHLLPAILLAPAAKASLDRAPGAVALRDVTPGRSGTQPPEQTVKNRAVVSPGTTSLVGLMLLGQKGFEDFILLICQFESFKECHAYHPHQ